MTTKPKKAPRTSARSTKKADTPRKAAKQEDAAKPKRATVQKVAPTPTRTTDEILGQAMLSNVCIRMWEGRKFDREVTEKVNDEYAASQDAGRYHKKLFGGKVPELSAIVTATAALRATHYAQTLPWSDEGWRLLPASNYMEYTGKMREAISKFDVAVEAFVKAYPRLKSEARERLNGMYRESDYPDPNTIVAKYRASLDFAPIPSGSDFRVSLPQQEIERITKDVEARVTKAITDAMTGAWERLGDIVSKFRERVDDGKYLRSSMLEKVKEVAELVGRLNVTQDSALEQLRARVVADLASLDLETLKEDQSARDEAVKKADDILKSMSSIYGMGA